MTLDKQFLKHYLDDHPASSLFPMYAEQLYQDDRLSEAAEVCASGLDQFPHLATGWLIYGKVALAQENYTDAQIYLWNALRSDRACLAAANLLLGQSELTLTEDDRSDLQSVLTEMGGEVEALVEEPAPEPEDNEDIPVEDLTEGADEDLSGEEPDVEESQTEEEPAEEIPSEEDADEILAELELEDETTGEEERKAGQHLKEDETEESDEDIPAKQADEDEILNQAFQEAMEDEPEFAPPEFEGEVLDEEGPEDFEEEFDLEELESEAEEDREIEEPEDADEEQPPMTEDEPLKRNHVDFAEMAHKDSERAPEATEEMRLSREQLEAMSQQELLGFLKKKYGLEGGQ